MTDMKLCRYFGIVICDVSCIIQLILWCISGCMAVFIALSFYVVFLIVNFQKYGSIEGQYLTMGYPIFVKESTLMSHDIRSFSAGIFQPP